MSRVSGKPGADRAFQSEEALHDERHDGRGWTMGGMGLVGLLVVIALFLAIAALVKYLFSRR